LSKNKWRIRHSIVKENIKEYWNNINDNKAVN
jgi:hypothetical protein